MKHQSKQVLVINALRARSGGAKAHLIGIIKNFDPSCYRFQQLCVVTYEEMASELRQLQLPYVTVYSPKATKYNILFQLFWEFFFLPRVFHKQGGTLLFNIDAGSLCRSVPYICLSQDLQSFEKGVMSAYWPSISWLRLYVLKFVQLKTIHNAQGVVFLTQYAKQKISSFLKHPMPRSLVVNHGVDPIFHGARRAVIKKRCGEKVKVLYVSNIAPYKNHHHIVDAARALPAFLNSVEFYFVGGGGKIFCPSISDFGCNLKFNFIDFIDKKDLIFYYNDCDLFLFASSCENMPITLMEGIAAGMPVLVSNRGPMSEVAGHDAHYFDPEKPSDLTDALVTFFQSDPSDYVLSDSVAKHWNWARCARETFAFADSVMFEVDNDRM